MDPEMVTKMDPQTEIQNIQILRYMGSKRNILDRIIPIIRSNIETDGIFFDMFSGTNSVAYAMKDFDHGNLPIMTNDVQSFSHVIAKALIENNKIRQISLEEAKDDLLENFMLNQKAVEKKWNNRFILSHQYRTRIVDGKKKSFQEFLNRNTDQLPFCLFSFYFSNVYFSLQQNKEIDSLRFAIEQIKNPIKKNIYLTCLLYAVSYGSSTFGHFAQPRRLTKEVKQIRKKSIAEIFFKKLEKLEIVTNSERNICFNEDYKKLLLSKKFNKIKNDINFIYMDPPYTPANYSRFYHILETLIEYDYPFCEFKGLYRQDRFKSDFCKPSKVEFEFNNVVQFAHQIDATLLISYLNSHLGLLSKRKILKICRNEYGKQHVISFSDVQHKHSTLGNTTKNSVKEVLVLCKNNSN